MSQETVDLILMQILVGKPEEKRKLGRSGNKGNVTVNLEETGRKADCRYL
jgi:hypothetical protein